MFRKWGFEFESEVLKVRFRKRGFENEMLKVKVEKSVFDGEVLKVRF